jgi:hypothetical protein
VGVAGVLVAVLAALAAWQMGVFGGPRPLTQLRQRLGIGPA